jgi:hypothetical protein
VTLGPATGGILHTVYGQNNTSASYGLSIQSSAALSTNGALNYVGVAGRTATGNDSQIGVYKHAGIANATAYLGLRTQDNVQNWIWVDDADQLRISTTLTNVGTTGGTVVGTQTSDERLKENIVPLSHGLNKLLDLEALEFDMFGSHKFGFSAQRTLPILPEIVFNTNEQSFGEKELPKLGMDYVQIIPILVKAIQQMNAKVESLSQAPQSKTAKAKK